MFLTCFVCSAWAAPTETLPLSCSPGNLCFYVGKSSVPWLRQLPLPLSFTHEKSSKELCFAGEDLWMQLLGSSLLNLEVDVQRSRLSLALEQARFFPLWASSPGFSLKDLWVRQLYLGTDKVCNYRMRLNLPQICSPKLHLPCSNEISLWLPVSMFSMWRMLMYYLSSPALGAA